MPQMKEFMYLWVLFMSEEMMQHEINRGVGAAGAVLHALHCTVVTKKGSELKGKALDLPVSLRSYPHLWS